ncbi:MAG TPA: hypothetical protein VHC86_06680 [Opitutaceae bacterium]|nr:hypothetical protein [Opitutaceae bacterium]
MKSEISSVNENAGFMTLANVRAARSALNAHGFLLIPGGYPREFCDSLVRVIDDYRPDERAEKNYAGSELRIWDAQKKHPLFTRFCEDSNFFVSCVEGTEMEAHTLLAIRNLAVPNHDASLLKGRWHLDSFRRMLKVFLFLTDTNEKSGPFEFVANTNRTSFKLKMFCAGRVIRPSDLIHKKRAYSRLDDNWIEGLGPQGYPSTPVLCQAGTVLVIDTSAIHRARPCIEGSRYALTAYYR